MKKDVMKHLDNMKKLYLIILLISSINAVGQKYKFTVGWQPVLQNGDYYTLKVGNSQIDKYYQKIDNVTNDIDYEYIDYELQLNPTDHLYFELPGATHSCGNIPGQFMDFSIQDILLATNTISDGCWGTGGILNFKPSEIVLNSLMIPEYISGNPVHYTICSGAQLEIFANIPNKNPIVDAQNYYPPSAFHWQYSIDKENWIDMPEYIVKNGVSIKNISYNTPKLTASIDEIIGLNHKDYYNKTIFFQLGRNTSEILPDPVKGYKLQNISYANLDYGVLYLPCTPIIKEPIVYVNPKCNGGTFQKLKVIFDRNLETGEKFDIMQVRENEESSPILLALSDNQTIDNLVDEHTVPPTFSYTFPVSKIGNGTYHIEYETTKNNIIRALISDFSPSFTVKIPDPLTFTITQQSNIECNEERTGSIYVTAAGGTPPYYYLLNPIDPNDFPNKIPFGAGALSCTVPNLGAGNNVIKVIDSNNCKEELIKIP